jgi:hypothetical protein
MGRLDWDPLPLEYLAGEREAARAAGDERMLTLLREISRLHWIAIRAHHLTLTITRPGANVRTQDSVAQDVHRILEREPAVIKDNRIRQESTRKPPGTAYSRKIDEG